MMDKVYSQFSDFCVFHVADVLVYDSSEKDCIEHLRMTFIKDQRRGSVAKAIKKCIFKGHLQYLEHLFSG